MDSEHETDDINRIHDSKIENEKGVDLEKDEGKIEIVLKSLEKQLKNIASDDVCVFFNRDFCIFFKEIVDTSSYISFKKLWVIKKNFIDRFFSLILYYFFKSEKIPKSNFGTAI